MLLAQDFLPYFYYSLRQLQRLLSSTRHAIANSESVYRAEGIRILLAQGPFIYFYYSLRQLQRLLSSTRLTIANSESVYRAESIRILLAQGPLIYFYYSLRQPQRLLSSTYLAIRKYKVAGYSLIISADIFKRKYPILLKTKIGIDIQYYRLSEPIVYSFKALRD